MGCNPKHDEGFKHEPMELLGSVLHSVPVPVEAVSHLPSI